MTVNHSALFRAQEALDNRYYNEVVCHLQAYHQWRRANVASAGCEDDDKRYFAMLEVCKERAKRAYEALLAMTDISPIDRE